MTSAQPDAQDRSLPSVNERRRGGLGVAFMVVFLALGLVSGGIWFAMDKLKGAAKADTAATQPEQRPVNLKKFDDPMIPDQRDPSLAAAPSSQAPLELQVPKIGGDASAGAVAGPAQPIALKSNRGAGLAATTVPSINGGPAGLAPVPTLERIPERVRDPRTGPTPSPYDSGFVVNGGTQPDRASASRASAAGEPTAAGTSLFGGTPSESAKTTLGSLLSPTVTSTVKAGKLGDLNLTAGEGTTVDCVLRTRIVASQPGMVICKTSTPLYSANGRVVLAERGSVVTGEQGGQMKQGQTRLFVLWRRIVTPEGIAIRLDSPGADQLGGSGIDGDVDNRWPQRIGAALLLSVVSDAIVYQTAKDASGAGAAAAAYQNTTQSGKSIAEKVLESTINIPPTLTRNQGDKITILVARDLDFSSVYDVRPH